MYTFRSHVNVKGVICLIEEAIVRYCAPTLAGLKTGSIVAVPVCGEEIIHEIKSLNKRLVKKGLCVMPLKRGTDKTLIYIYRPDQLLRDLKNSLSCRLLQEKGYCSASPAQCIFRLMQRLENVDEFPHEIGLFLGYPAEDVQGFIENKACSFKLAGCWKVYGNVERALACFEQYKKCTRIYCDCMLKGASIEQLAVAI